MGPAGMPHPESGRVGAPGASRTRSSEKFERLDGDGELLTLEETPLGDSDLPNPEDEETRPHPLVTVRGSGGGER